MKYAYILLALVPVLMLNACVDQATADEKMAKGCVAAVNALLDDSKVIDVSETLSVTEDFQGEGLHRRITMTVVEKDGWLELENKYSCVFLEQWGPLRMSHGAILVQVDVNGDIYGKNNGSIVGDWDDFLAITRVVDAAMGQ